MGVRIKGKSSRHILIFVETKWCLPTSLMVFIGILLILRKNNLCVNKGTYEVHCFGTFMSSHNFKVSIFWTSDWVLWKVYGNGTVIEHLDIRINPWATSQGYNCLLFDSGSFFLNRIFRPKEVESRSLHMWGDTHRIRDCQVTPLVSSNFVPFLRLLRPFVSVPLVES